MASGTPPVRALATAPARHGADLLGVLLRLDPALTGALAARQRGDATPPRALLDLDLEPADSRFRRIAEAYRLSEVEVDLLLVVMAPLLDARYGELFACVEEDMSRVRPTVSVALAVLGLSPAERLTARQLFDPASTLVAGGLLRLKDPPGMPDCPLPLRELVVEDRIADYVLGSDGVATDLAGLVEVVPLPAEACGADRLVLPFAARRRLDALCDRPQPRCVLRGPQGSGRQAVAQVLAAAWGVSYLLRVRTDRLARDDPDRFAGQVRAVGREARLRGSATYWDGFDVLLDDDRVAPRDVVLAELDRHEHAFFSTSVAWPPGQLPPAVELVLPPVDAARRVLLWRRALAATGGVGPREDEIEALAAAFQVGPGTIGAAVAEATATGEAAAPDLAAIVRRHGAAAMAKEAERVDQPFDWDDLVIPPDRLQLLHAIGDRIRHRALVHDRWAFAAILGRARGTAALFTGPSGTGKTMAAGILARSLGLDLYRVDLAGLVSKYIGETEKNLARVFAAAEGTDAVLLFDEADALFGKRTEVRDAHDRYANLEVAYLLQRIEQHDGVVVLATNLRKNIDEAFLRRLTFVVEFPLPDREHRRLIWRRMFPPAAPLDPALDLDLLADHFELSGGSIRNVAVEAAFAAAASGRAIDPDHVATALRHEHQKLGRVPPDLLRIAGDPGRTRTGLQAFSAGGT
jgi:MoxR-like ATPase